MCWIKFIWFNFVELVFKRPIHSCLECHRVNFALEPDAWHIIRHHFELSHQYWLSTWLELLQSTNRMPILQHNIYSNYLVFKCLYSCLSRLHLGIQILRKYTRRTEVRGCAGEAIPHHALVVLFQLLAIFSELVNRRQNMCLFL
jgi:hypothetical protein